MVARRPTAASCRRPSDLYPVERQRHGAQPGATIRVFRKKTPEGGELESFLGEAKLTAAETGKSTYPAEVPTGTSVAATQTSASGGTSELSRRRTRRTQLTCPAARWGQEGAWRAAASGKVESPMMKLSPATKIPRAPKGTLITTAKFKFNANE